MDLSRHPSYRRPDEGAGAGGEAPQEEAAEGGSTLPPQVLHLALAFAVGIIIFLTARSILVPPSFGEFGFYRGTAVAEHATKQQVHAGQEACKTCHEDKPASPHVVAGVSCESCHGPALKHVEDFENNKPFRPSSRAFCGRCHQKLAGRPTAQPQVDLATHNPTEKCITCHEIHPQQVSK